MKAVCLDHACLLCGSKDYALLHNKGRHNQIVHNHICNQCGFTFVLPRPSGEKIETLYKDGLFSRNERSSSVPDDRKFLRSEAAARDRIKILESFFGNQLFSSNPRSVLEVGCGTGSFLRLMKGCGWKVLGLEPDATYASVAAERYKIRIENRLIEEWNPDKKFDLICSFHVIEHVEDPNSFLGRIHQLLNDDGYLFLECPSIDRWYGKSIDFFFWDVHINTFSEKVLYAFLVKSGFEPAAVGWNGNGLWVLAKKGTKSDAPIIADDSNRIRHIIQDAIAQTAQEADTSQIARISQRIKSFVSHPEKIPHRISKKVHRVLNLPESKGIEALAADKIALKPSRRERAKLKIAHVGLHVQVNAGDTLLFPAVRWLFQTQLAPIDFCLIPLRVAVTEATIDKINQQDALIIGGGGLFLADSNPNNASGWQWACPPELLERIKVPIIVFAVGYNRFRGQSEFATIFQDSIYRLIEKSAFFSVRNHGSIAALKSYLPSHLHDKIRFQPCPTTILNRFYPNLPQCIEDQVLAVNVAFDRHHLRFGGQESEILWNLAEALLELQGNGWRIKLFCHTQEDIDARLWFRAKGLNAEVVNLYQVPPDMVLKEYATATIAVGMRGHAQMIPFGFGCPIYSLISHDKLRFFLEDISHPEWGIEVQNPNLKSKVVQDLSTIAEDWTATKNQVLEAQDQIWQLTQHNIVEIQSILGLEN